VVGTVGQDPLAHFVTDTVEDELAYGMESLGLAPEVMRRRVEETLDLLGLADLRDRALATLSGGQMQRMLFARVLLQDARLIVLDEPFNAIDAKTSTDLLALVKRWHAEGRTVLAALHDLDMVRANFPETLLLARGPVAWGPTAQALTPENLLVAMKMCEAFDDRAAACAADAPSRAA
jgi:zinc/manganese transport system ATP-binding protein